MKSVDETCAGEVVQGPVRHRDFTSSLFVKVAAAEPEGWLRLEAIVRWYVLGSALKAGIPAQDAEDLAQEVCVDVTRYIGSFRGKRSGHALRAWLGKIMAHKIADYFRAHSHRPEGEPIGGDQAELAQIAEPQRQTVEFDPHTEEGQLGILNAAMALVSAIVQPQAWEAFREVALGNRDVAEVASELGMTRHAVSDAVYRVRRLVIRAANKLHAAQDDPA